MATTSTVARNDCGASTCKTKIPVCPDCGEEFDEGFEEEEEKEEPEPVEEIPEVEEEAIPEAEPEQEPEPVLPDGDRPEAPEAGAGVQGPAEEGGAVEPSRRRVPPTRP